MPSRDTLRNAGKLGYAAGRSGATISDCPYGNIHLKGAWVEGWLRGSGDAAKTRSRDVENLLAENRELRNHNAELERRLTELEKRLLKGD